MNSPFKNYTIIFTLLVVSSLVSYLVSSDSILIGGIPVIYLCLAFSFFVNWLVFFPSFILKTERYFDLFGSITFISIASFAIYSKVTFEPELVDHRSIALALLIVVWAVRLGSFLFIRVLKEGHDKRFSETKKSFSSFLMWWSMQAFWAFMTSVCAVVAITSLNSKGLDVLYYFAFFLWLIGFIFQAVADSQKSRFKSNINNKNKFINVGLWSISRHPNYFGEIVMWIAVALISLPVLSGWQHVSLVSPFFVYLLLTRASGIPILEERAEKKWGGDESYIRYKSMTPRLFPKIF